MKAIPDATPGSLRDIDGREWHVAWSNLHGEERIRGAEGLLYCDDDHLGAPRRRVLLR